MKLKNIGVGLLTLGLLYGCKESKTVYQMAREQESRYEQLNSIGQNNYTSLQIKIAKNDSSWKKEQKYIILDSLINKSKILEYANEIQTDSTDTNYKSYSFNSDEIDIPFGIMKGNQKRIPRELLGEPDYKNSQFDVYKYPNISSKFDAFIINYGLGSNDNLKENIHSITIVKKCSQPRLEELTKIEIPFG